MTDSVTITVASKQDPALKGDVTLILPSGADYIKIGIAQARLRGGVPLDQLDTVSAGVVVMLSTLSVVVKQAPDWWYDIKREKQPDGTEKEFNRTPAPERIKDLDVLWQLYGRWVALRDADGSPSQPAEAATEVAR